MATQPLDLVLQHLRRLLGGGPAEEADDRRLLDAFARSRDEAAFEELVRRHGPLVWGVCLALGVDFALSTPSAGAIGHGEVLGFAHGALVRRPASGEKWEGQGKPVYATFERTGPATVSDVVALHLAAHGPSSRQDVAWWSGMPLGAVEEGLAGLDVVEDEGPDGRAYVDLADAPPPRDLPGVRLLPEFDALLCGYDSKVRDRFVTAEHHRRLWNESNGMLLPPLLVDGRITGFWRAAGTARRRPLEVTWFARTRRPRRAELDEPVAALEAALDITVTEVSLTREQV